MCYTRWDQHCLSASNSHLAWCTCLTLVHPGCVQALVRPGLDVFLEGQQPISSLVVIPFKFTDDSGAVCRGGVYVASTEPGDFAESKRAIVSTVAVVQWLLEPHVQPGGMLAVACTDVQTSKVNVSGIGT